MLGPWPRTVTPPDLRPEIMRRKASVDEPEPRPISTPARRKAWKLRRSVRNGPRRRKSWTKRITLNPAMPAQRINRSTMKVTSLSKNGVPRCGLP